MRNKTRRTAGYGYNPEPHLPSSWREGIGTYDPKDYPEDGSLRVWKKMIDCLGDEKRSEPQARTVPARPEDWERVRGLLEETKAVRRDKIGTISESGEPEETYVDMSTFGMNYMRSMQEKEAGIKQHEPWVRFRIIEHGNQQAPRRTAEEEMEIVNARIADIESRLPE